MSEDPRNQDMELTEPQNPLPPITFEELPGVMRFAANRAGWTELTPVQSRAIPYLQARRDLMVQARTGSGKTGAFILPLIDQVDKNRPQCQALVLVPTRELAQQVAAETGLLAGDNGMRTVAVYGGTSYKPQIAAFKAGVQCVIGTPGRILDHLIKRNLNFKNLKFLIYDEADRMMSMGFYPDMLQIQEFLPREEISGYMFSATIPPHVIRLAQQFLNAPDFLSLSSDHVHVKDTGHIYYLIPGMEKERSLVRIIEMETPQQAIVFCNTKARVNYVTAILQRYGFNADQISSGLSQNARDKVIKKIRDGRLRFLVATDVAARGIDIPDLSHVIQYEPPEDVEAYIHRAGRTGRAGASGTAIMLININEKSQLNRIAAHYQIEFEKRPLPNEEDVQSLVAQRLVGHLEARLRARDKLQIDRMQRFFPLAQDLAGNEDGLALLAMLLDDSYHAWMHRPPELPPAEIQLPPGKSQRKKRKSRYRNNRKKKGSTTS